MSDENNLGGTFFVPVEAFSPNTMTVGNMVEIGVRVGRLPDVPFDEAENITIEDVTFEGGPAGTFNGRATMVDRHSYLSWRIIPLVNLSPGEYTFTINLKYNDTSIVIESQELLKVEATEEKSVMQIVTPRNAKIQDAMNTAFTVKGQHLNHINPSLPIVTTPGMHRFKMMGNVSSDRFQMRLSSAGPDITPGRYTVTATLENGSQIRSIFMIEIDG